MIDNKTPVLIVRHPQEEDKALGTAPLIQSLFKNVTLVTALSRPSLKSLLKSEDVVQSEWGVLYLGAASEKKKFSGPGLYFLDRKGNEIPKQPLKGIVLLDGSWAQAKALWWRNPWLLKLKRLVLIPPKPSIYGSLRKEPRKESLSCLEAVAYTLSYFEDSPGIAEEALRAFDDFLRPRRRG